MPRIDVENRNEMHFPSPMPIKEEEALQIETPEREKKPDPKEVEKYIAEGSFVPISLQTLRKYGYQLVGSSYGAFRYLYYIRPLGEDVSNILNSKIIEHSSSRAKLFFMQAKDMQRGFFLIKDKITDKPLKLVGPVLINL